MSRTIGIYGPLLGIIVFELLFLFFSGIYLSNETILMLALANGLAFVIAISADSFGFLCLMLAWLAFDNGPIKAEIGIATFTPFMGGILVLALVVAIRVTIGGKRFPFTPTDIAVLLLLLTYSVSTSQAENIIDSGYLAVHGLLLPACSYFAIKGLVTNPAELRRALGFLLTGLLAFCSAAAVAAALGMASRRDTLGRDAIGIATMGVTVVCYLLYGFQRARAQRILGALIGAAPTVGLFARGYMVGLLASRFIFGAIRKGLAVTVLVTFLVLTVAGTAFFTFSPELFRPHGYSLSKENSEERLKNPEYWKAGAYDRLIAFRWAEQDFVNHPIFGTGLYRGPEGGATTHNFHWEWLQYGGLFGYILYASVFLCHFTRMGRVAPGNRIVAASLTLLLLILINGLMNGFMHGIMPIFAFIAMGIAEAEAAVQTAEEEAPQEARPILLATAR